MNKKSSSLLQKILLAVGILILAFGLVCAWGVYSYVSNVPKITLKQDEFHVPVGTTLTPEDLADFECRGEYETGFYLTGCDVDSVKLSEDRKELFVGNDEGSITVTIYGRGLHSEGRTTDDIKIFVE